jgi:hypothetical protein
MALIKCSEGPEIKSKAREFANAAPNKKNHWSIIMSTKTILPAKKKQHKISFHEGGLHASTGTSSLKKISPAKHAAAKSGKLGPKAKKQEMFYENVLKHRKA